MKVCNGCSREKTLDSFYRNPSVKSGYAAICKECNKERAIAWRKNNMARFLEIKRASNRKKRYGISIETYNRMLIEQKGECKICKSKFRNLQIDHDHSTGKIRGLLCNPCNRILGMAKDSTLILASAIQYLSMHKIINLVLIKEK